MSIRPVDIDDMMMQTRGIKVGLPPKAYLQWGANRRYNADFQMKLMALGYNPGPIDGILGPLTERAFEDWEFRGAGHEADLRAGPPWLKEALLLNGTKEIKGKYHNPKILDMWRWSHLSFVDDETPWCAGYVGFCMEKAGFKSTRSGAARSYSTRPDLFRKLPAPAVGAIAVYWRKHRNSGLGHVGIVAGKGMYDQIMVISGNADDMVKIAPYGTSRLIGYYWPLAYDEDPNYNLPVIRSDGSSVETED